MFTPVGMQEKSAKGSVCLREGGLQEITAAQSLTAAIVSDLALMQFKDIFQSQKSRHVVLLGKLLKSLFGTRIYLTTRFSQFFFPTVLRGGGEPNGRTIGG